MPQPRNLERRIETSAPPPAPASTPGRRNPPSRTNAPRPATPTSTSGYDPGTPSPTSPTAAPPDPPGTDQQPPTAHARRSAQPARPEHRKPDHDEAPPRSRPAPTTTTSSAGSLLSRLAHSIPSVRTAVAHQRSTPTSRLPTGNLGVERRPGRRSAHVRLLTMTSPRVSILPGQPPCSDEGITRIGKLVVIHRR